MFSFSTFSIIPMILIHIHIYIISKLWNNKNNCQFVEIVHLSIRQNCKLSKTKSQKKTFSNKKILEKEKEKNFFLQSSICQFVEIVHLSICRNCELSKKISQKKFKKIQKNCFRKKRRKACQFDHLSEL